MLHALLEKDSHTLNWIGSNAANAKNDHDQNWKADRYMLHKKKAAASSHRPQYLQPVDWRHAGYCNELVLHRPQSLFRYS